MRSLLAIVVSLFAASTIFSAAYADTQPAPKGPPKTMGDEGKLPATRAVSDTLPDQRGPDAPARASDALTETGAKRMGDEGRLPATGAVSGSVPEMNAPDK